MDERPAEGEREDVPGPECAADEDDHGKKASHHRKDPWQPVGGGESSDHHTPDERDKASYDIPARAGSTGRLLSLFQRPHTSG